MNFLDAHLSRASQPALLRIARKLQLGTFGLAALAMAAIATGCGSSNAQVHGKVTLPDGSPAIGVVVSFQEPTLQLGATGVTDMQGVYNLHTEKPGDGAPLGNYKIAVFQPGPADSSQPDPPRLFPKRYENRDQSQLAFEVKPGDNEFNIALAAQ